jgi:hypothetical protein
VELLTFDVVFYVFFLKLQKNQANEEKDETPTEGYKSDLEQGAYEPQDFGVHKFIGYSFEQ